MYVREGIETSPALWLVVIARAGSDLFPFSSFASEGWAVSSSLDGSVDGWFLNR